MKKMTWKWKIIMKNNEKWNNNENNDNENENEENNDEMIICNDEILWIIIINENKCNMWK